jgi:hypothetical protein
VYVSNSYVFLNPALVVHNNALNLIVRMNLLGEAANNLCPNGSLHRPGIPCVTRRHKPIHTVSFICRVIINRRLDPVSPLNCLDFDSMLDETELSQQAVSFGAEGAMINDTV